MQTTNFKCNACGNIFEVIKERITEDFPTTIKCDQCKSLETHRIWSIGDIAIAEGKSELGYTQYSKFGKYKGAKIK